MPRRTPQAPLPRHPTAGQHEFYRQAKRYCGGEEPSSLRRAERNRLDMRIDRVSQSLGGIGRRDRSNHLVDIVVRTSGVARRHHVKTEKRRDHVYAGLWTADRFIAPDLAAGAAHVRSGVMPETCHSLLPSKTG